MIPKDKSSRPFYLIGTSVRDIYMARVKVSRGWGVPLNAVFSFLDGNTHPEKTSEDVRVLQAAATQVPQLIGTMSIAAIDSFEFTGATDVRRRLLFADEDSVRRLTVKEAKEFAERYAVGIQHVSEILLVWDLWPYRKGGVL